MVIQELEQDEVINGLNKELVAVVMRKGNEEDQQDRFKGQSKLQGRVEEMEEELETERQARAKAERQCPDVAGELESLGESLNEATGTTAAQIELNKE